MPEATAAPTADPARRAAGDRGRALRREGLQEHHGARHRRRRRHPLRQPLPPLRLQGVDGRRDPVDVPGGAVRAVRRDPGQRRRPAHQARAGGPASPSRRSTSTATRSRSSRTRRPTSAPSTRFAYLAERNAQSREVWMTLLQRGRRRRRAARRPRPRAHLPLHPRHRLGRGRAGTAPAARYPRPRSPTSTSPSSSKGSPMSLRPTSSTPSAPRSASAAARSPACTPPTSPRTRSPRWCDRTGVDPGAVDDVILGCCDTIGSQAGDVARTAWLVAGLPDHVPGVTIDRQCGSSQQAVHFAAQGVMSGTQDLVVAGGVQNMSAIPISAAMLVGQQYGFSTPFAESPGLAGAVRRPGGQPVPLRRDDRREVGHLPRGHGGVRARLARAGAHRDRRGPLQGRDRAVALPTGRASTPTSARARPRWRRWPASSRWLPAAGSPPRSPRRSATPRPRC